MYTCIQVDKSAGLKISACMERARSKVLEQERFYTYMHTFKHTYMYTCVHANIRAYIRAYMHACTHTHTRAYMHACMHTHTHTHTHTLVYTHTCTLMTGAPYIQEKCVYVNFCSEAEKKRG